MAKKNWIEPAVPIVDLGAKGKAVGKKDGKVYFVDGAVPGDVCDVQVYRKKKSFFEGKAVSFETLSTDRVEAKCTHFGTCGGCKWQNLSYEAQIKHKENDVKSNIKKIGGVTPAEYLPIIGSEDTYYYRNKLEFTFTNNRWLMPKEVSSNIEIEHRNGVGFHMPGLWDKVLDINHCHLQAEPSNSIRNFVREFAVKNNLTFYDLRKHQGFLRTLMIRTATTGQVMVVFQLGEENEEAMNSLFTAVIENFPQITSLQFAINLKQNDSIYDLDIKVWHGNDYILEEMEPYFKGNEKLKFKIGPKSFYQTNSKQAAVLYRTALDFAAVTDGQTVYDLYTGTGTIALFMAQMAKKVVGIESVPEAVNDAFENAKLNGISNANFVAGDMKKTLNDEFISAHGVPDIIVTDPPRDGMHADVVAQLLELEVPKIVYISCNPATQARDLALLRAKYDVIKSRAVDMFPQTHHIENIVLLQKR